MIRGHKTNLILCCVLPLREVMQTWNSSINMELRPEEPEIAAQELIDLGFGIGMRLVDSAKTQDR